MLQGYDRISISPLQIFVVQHEKDVFSLTTLALSSFFGTDNVLCPQFVIDWPSMWGVEKKWRLLL